MYSRTVTAAAALAVSIGVASIASAADLGAPPPAQAPIYTKAPPLPMWSWTGLYVGGNVGYGFGKSSNDYNTFASNTAGPGFPCSTLTAFGSLCAGGSDTNKITGAIGGLQAGYNWQMGTWLTGVETDIQISGQRGSNTFATGFLAGFGGLSGVESASYTEKLPWFGTLRGRSGLTFGRWLVYGTGGLAYGEVDTSGIATATGPNGPGFAGCTPTGCVGNPLGNWSHDQTRIGWTAGAGVEGAIAHNWTMKVEYLYVDLGSITTNVGTPPGCYGNQSGGVAGCSFVSAGSTTIHSLVTDSIVRVGLNYKLY
jgi:outer membrane immunogenic protein